MKTVRIEDNKNNIVKKHNELIQKARYSLSEVEIKIVSTLISMIKTDDTEFHQYLIDIKELQKLTNTNTNDRVLHQYCKIIDEQTICNRK